MEEPNQTPGSINQNPQTFDTPYNKTRIQEEREVDPLEEQVNIQLVASVEEQENIRRVNIVHGVDQGNAQQQSNP